MAENEGKHESVTPAQPEATQESQEYIDQMTAKAEGGLGSQPEEKLLAGKYKTEEDLTQGILELAGKTEGGLEAFYKNLEKGIGGVQPEAEGDPEGDPEGEAEAEGEDETEEKDKTPSLKDLDFNKYAEEIFSEDGMSEETRKEILDHGITEEFLDSYVSGQKALVTIAKQHAFNLVGGEENYGKMINWADKNLTQAEKEVFNKGIATQDLDQRGAYIANMFNRFTQSNPQLLEGDGNTLMQGGGYNSMAEFQADIRDPRYQKDNAFRAEVEKKVGMSPALFNG